MGKTGYRRHGVLRSQTVVYHYTESGLDNVWLENGFTVENHPAYGELVSIADIDGLHRAIGRVIVNQVRSLNGAEFRFLRVELDMSQRALGAFLGVTDQAIAKWEKARAKPVINTSADRLLRTLYLARDAAGAEIVGMIERLRDLDPVPPADLHMANADHNWREAA
jgi:putative transcriptional regulator